MAKRKPRKDRHRKPFVQICRNCNENRMFRYVCKDGTRRYFDCDICGHSIGLVIKKK